MELREWAIRILSADRLDDKLFAPSDFTDHSPGPPVRWKEPSRPPGMEMRLRQKKEKLPKLWELQDPEKCAICLHRFAGHELLAVEMMAFALLAFPEAPSSFRKGVAHTLQEEQEHVRLYCQRLSELGVQFGQMPLFRHFWTHIPDIQTPLNYISLMSLTFEMANLDFAPTYGRSFETHGDWRSSQLMGRILQDEIRHVRFGWRWLCQWKKEDLSTWQTWTESLPKRVMPKRAMGMQFYSEYREKAGIPKEWIDRFRDLHHSKSCPEPASYGESVPQEQEQVLPLKWAQSL